jgi:copper(I)-binding protein
MIRHIVFVAVLAVATPALAQAPSVHLQNAWARATAPQATSGLVYLTVIDTGAPDRLIAAASPVAGVVQLHETVNDNGIMKMPPIPALAVSPGKPAVLKPGGYHIMLMHMKQQLKPGEHFPITLTFAKAGKLTAIVTVTTAGASSAPTSDEMGGMPMSK